MPKTKTKTKTMRPQIVVGTEDHSMYYALDLDGIEVASDGESARVIIVHKSRVYSRAKAAALDMEDASKEIEKAAKEAAAGDAK